MDNLENLSRDEKITWITQKSYEMLKAMFDGHKHTVGDKFEEYRKLINKWRQELGLTRNDFVYDPEKNNFN